MCPHAPPLGGRSLAVLGRRCLTVPCSCVLSISITTSCFPVPSICFRDPVNDWFESLGECLHWNVRKKQNHLGAEDEDF